MLWLLATVLAAAGLLILAWPSDSEVAPRGPRTSAATGPSTKFQQDNNPDVGSSSLAKPRRSATAASPEGMAVIEGFAVDFTRSGNTRVWAQRLTNWVTPQLAMGFAQTDSSRRPTGEVVGLTPHGIGARATEAVVRYDTGLTVYVRAEYGTTGWRVTSVLPIQDDH